ncbi:M56 family metallopeptidase [Flavivirga algicola]|uniref:M56 family metallopeptidase n=1 Tax=Flavivirga algicola TaxID=2729136 RepID=A0ABX1RW45_9FLAO|nr:M56 family metallopeptidase [Flavivirga algicola]NMH87381.1 M56 family metallopeptidase [Flavivirga algicola]
MSDLLYAIVLNLFIDSLWLAGFSWLLLFILLRVISIKHATLRYTVSLIVFFGFFIILIILAIAQKSIYNLWLKPKILMFSDYISKTSFEFNLIEHIQLFVVNNSLNIFWFWFLGLSIFITKFLIQFGNFSRIQETTLTHSSLNQIKGKLAKQLGINKEIRLKETSNTSYAFTTGIFKPIIFFPAQALTGFSIESLEIILIHELVHIKRNDYVVNIAQLLLEIIFFFNPFVLFMSSIIRKERETSCDAIVIDHGYSKILYARALKNSYELHYKLALNFGQKNVFSRIKRLTPIPLNQRKNKSLSQLLMGGAALCIMLTTLGFGVSIKSNLSNTTIITKDTNVYPKLTFKEKTGTIIFHPDEHRSWHIHKNGEQDFYKDGVLKNEELDANFEYKEIDKGDFIEILFIDKLLKKEHKGAKKPKEIFDSKPFIEELYKDHGLKDKDYNINKLIRKFHITPFGDMYFNDKKVNTELKEKYLKKYPSEAFEYYHDYPLEKKAETIIFVEKMIQELQKDGLVNADFELAQVVFQLQKEDVLLLNGRKLSKKSTEKYLIYLNRFSAGFLYECHAFYLK